MPFKVIAGTFQVVNYSPDGDSIRFHPADPGHLKGLSGPSAKINARGDVQLRIEAIDALETHYQSPGGGNHHQPFDLAQQARQRLLDFAGITGVVWDNRQMTVTAANDGTPGYILTRAVEKYGRPIAFVFAGDPPEADGGEAFLDADRLRDSYNYMALAEGLTFPTYYTVLFADLRNALTEATAKARADKLGIHTRDVTTAGFDADTLATITDDVVILPKLFRRVIDYMVNMGSAVGFKEKLAESREPVLDLSTANFTHFDTFVEQEPGSTRIRLTLEPELLVFDAMPLRRPDHFAAMLSGETALADDA
jgi:endonuclease YncB( thermonuclease family)